MEKSEILERNIKETIIYDHIVRRYYMHLPPRYFDASSPLSLLIALHGRYSTGISMSKQTGFNKVADRKEFIVVYPDGVKRSWADGRGVTQADKRGVNDVAFIGHLIKMLQSRFPIDDNKICITGYSNGGFMAQRLAMESSHPFAAMAIVSASLSDSMAERFTPRKLIPVLFIHGTADSVIPYGGGMLSGGKTALSVENAVKFWVRLNGCSTLPILEKIDQLDDGAIVSVLTYGSSQSHIQVKLYKIEGGGHVWPSNFARLPFDDGKGVRQVSASEEMWKFFESVMN